MSDWKWWKCFRGAADCCRLYRLKILSYWNCVLSVSPALILIPFSWTFYAQNELPVGQTDKSIKRNILAESFNPSRIISESPMIMKIVEEREREKVINYDDVNRISDWPNSYLLFWLHINFANLLLYIQIYANAFSLSRQIRRCYSIKLPLIPCQRQSCTVY